MELKQNDFEHIKDLLQKSEITTDRANVMMVLAQRVKLVTSPIPANVRKALNSAVKLGELGHLKKDGNKPEAFFNKTFEYLVASERNDHAKRVLMIVSSVCC